MTSPLSEIVDELIVRYHDERTRSSESLIARLRDLFEPGSEPFADDGRKTKRKAASAPSPVADRPFGLVMAIEAGARRLEAELRDALGFGQIARHTTTQSSLAALRALPDLAEALPRAHEVRVDVERTVGRWHRSALTLTGHRDRWPRVTRFYDTDAEQLVVAACPYCSAQSLRQRPDERVVCCTPSCRDPEGRRPSWKPDELERLGLVLRAAS